MPRTTRSQLPAAAWLASRLMREVAADLFEASTVTIRPTAGGVPVSSWRIIVSIVRRQRSAVGVLPAGPPALAKLNCGAFWKLKGVSNVPSCAKPKPVSFSPAVLSIPTFWYAPRNCGTLNPCVSCKRSLGMIVLFVPGAKLFTLWQELQVATPRSRGSLLKKLGLAGGRVWNSFGFGG